MGTRKCLMNRFKSSSFIVLLCALTPLVVSFDARAQQVPAAQQTPSATSSWRAALDQSIARLGLDELATAQGNEVRTFEARANRRFAGPLEADGGLRQDAIGSGRGYYEAEAGLMAPLWRRGERALLREQAASRGNTARFARAVVALEAAGDLRDAYWAYALARETAAIDAEQASRAADVVAQVNRLSDGGEMSRLELRQAEIAAANAAQVATGAAGEATSARLAFEVLAGQNVANLPQEIEGRDASNHPRLALAQAQASQIRNEARLMSASAYPRWRVGVDVRAERGMRGEDLGVSTGIRAAIPLGPDYSARAQAASVLTDATRADIALRRTQLNIDLKIAQSRNQLSTAQTRLSQAETAAIAAQDALMLSERGRREGELSFLEELRARSLAADAARTSAQARVAVSAAISDLNQAIGLLP